MAEEAQLRVKADARQIRRVSQEMDRMGTAGGRAVKKVSHDLKDVDRTVDELRKKQERLNKEFEKLDRGSQGWRRMREEIRLTTRQLQEHDRAAQRAAGGRVRDERGRFIAGAGGGGAGDDPDLKTKIKAAFRRVGRGARAIGGAPNRLMGGVGGAFARQAIGAIGGAGPEQAFGTLGGMTGALGQAGAQVPIIGAAIGIMGAITQAGFNVLQRRAGMFLSAEKARQQAGAFIRPASITGTARAAAGQGMSPEQAFGIMSSFGRAGGYRAGGGTLELARMGFSGAAMGGAELFGPGMSTMFATGGVPGPGFKRGRAGKMMLREMAAQLAIEEERQGGTAAELTPGRVEKRLVDMVGYLKQMATEGVLVDPRAFLRMSTRVLALGQQGIPGVAQDTFMAGRAFGFMKSMRGGQRQQGSLVHMAAMMTVLNRGGTMVQAMEAARMGRVNLPGLQAGLRGIRGGRGENDLFDFMVAQQLGPGTPMGQVTGLMRGDLSQLPTGFGARAKRGLAPLLGAAPIATQSARILAVQARELGRGEKSMDQFVKAAEALETLGTHLADAAKGNWNNLLKALKSIHDKLAWMTGNAPLNIKPYLLEGGGPTKTQKCWVARVVIPERWRDVRFLLFEVQPDWVVWVAWLYEHHGEALARELEGDQERIAELRPAFEVLADAGAALRSVA